MPLVVALGFNPIWYGVLYTITCQIAYMTPPFGYNLFLMRAMAPPEIKLPDIYRSIIPFVLVMTFGLAIVIVFPQVALVAAGVGAWWKVGDPCADLGLGRTPDHRYAGHIVPRP